MPVPTTASPIPFLSPCRGARARVPCGRSGFTLIELAVVLFILSAVVSILLPRLPGLDTGRRNASLRRLSACVQALHEQALFQKRSLALIYDLDEHSYRSGEWDDQQRDYVETAGLACKEVALARELRFQDVETDLDGLVDRGRALTRFLPQGYATPTWVHLTDPEGDVQYTLVVHPLLGRAEIFDERIAAD